MAGPREGQFIGCLVGQGLGDALGVPVEGCDAATCRQYVEEILGAGRAGAWRRQPYPFGQYSDDTQLARELLDGLVAAGGLDAAAFGRRVARLFAEGRVVGGGLATARAAWRLHHGVDWEKAGSAPPSAGNGSAMRAAPIGLWYFDDPPALIQAACDQGRVTHQDRRCQAGAVAIAGAVALALQGGPLDQTAFLDRLAAWVGGVEPGFGDHLRALSGWLRLSPGDAVRPIARAGLAPDARLDWEGVSPFVVGSVLWSLYAFLRSPADYWQSVCTAIVVGGDVDTTAAMTGAISGAHLGIDALPGPLARRLTDRGSWGFDELCQLARQAYQVRMAGRGQEGGAPAGGE